MSVAFFAKADEGMWLPILINQNMATMTEMGIKLTADDIYNVNKSSIKDAIVALDHGNCTGEVISGEGLVLTNHHCGYGEIQSHSTVENDYLTNGFWAKSKKEELANPGKTMSFLINVEDVTERVLAVIPEGTEQALRNHLVDSISTIIAEEAKKGTHYEAMVESMFKGNNFYVFTYETFRDIRLVGAPPESIGKFGADTDNWMWPRHTGDFSMFRIYSGPDGKPADYSEENIPLKPKHFLPISLDGIKDKDFAFIMGYPGNTDRFMTSYELKYTMEYANPNRAKIRGIKQDVWKKDMDSDTKIRIQYATKHSRSANYWKYSIEQNKALKKLNVYDDKVKLETEFTEWVNKDEARKTTYGNALKLIDESFTETTNSRNAQQYIIETQFYGYGESYLFAYRAGDLAKALATPDSVELIKTEIEKFKTVAANFFKNYSKITDQKAAPVLLKLFINDVNAEYYPDYINNIVNKKYKGDVDKYFANFFNKSIFVDEAKLNAFLEKPSTKTLDKDPAIIAINSILNSLRAFSAASYAPSLKYQEGMRLFVAGLKEMNPDKVYADDANSTMRLTYGTVGDYYPADAVHYDYFTTLEGVMEKEDPDVREFNVPARLKEIYKNKEYGDYGNADGTMTVCFTTNNDITGGNSGSPVINAKGELIGAAFDGNSEAMSGDIAFEKTMQKCINVDIRYVLLIIDKFAGAQNLIDELKLVKTETTEKTEAKEPVLEGAM
jgi:hypothetical protein